MPFKILFYKVLLEGVGKAKLRKTYIYSVIINQRHHLYLVYSLFHFKLRLHYITIPNKIVFQKKIFK